MAETFPGFVLDTQSRSPAPDDVLTSSTKHQTCDKTKCPELKTTKTTSEGHSMRSEHSNFERDCKSAVPDTLLQELKGECSSNEEANLVISSLPFNISHSSSPTQDTVTDKRNNFEKSERILKECNPSDDLWEASLQHVGEERSAVEKNSAQSEKTVLSAANIPVKTLEYSKYKETVYHAVKVDKFLKEMPLPPGWIGVLHESGAFVYCHLDSRVITWSRPYTIGKTASIRKHKVPSYAIPCLRHKIMKMYERKKKLAKWREKISSKTERDSDELSTTDKEENDTQNDTNDHKLYLLEANQVNEYLKTGFDMCILSGPEWSRSVISRGEEYKAEVIPDALKGIPQISEMTKKGDCLWSTNAAGKSPCMILHEYSQRAFKTAPLYNEIKPLNPNDGYGMEIVIGNIKCGVGYGQSKKAAKHKAAEETLAILLPGQYSAVANFEVSDEHLKIFDTMKITDERVHSYVRKLNLATPGRILQRCLNKHHGNDNVPSDYSFHKVKAATPQGGCTYDSYKMVCGKHIAEGTFRSKTVAKQRCAQQILQLLHPCLSMWGSIMRLYGTPPSKLVLEPKVEDGYSRLGLSGNPKNEGVIEALKKEMRHIAKQKKTGPESYPKKVKNVRRESKKKKISKKRHSDRHHEHCNTSSSNTFEGNVCRPEKNDGKDFQNNGSKMSSSSPLKRSDVYSDVESGSVVFAKRAKMAPEGVKNELVDF